MIPHLDSNQIYGPSHLNRIGEAVNVFNDLHRSRQRPAGTQYGANHGVIWVKNGSGADRKRFEALALGAPITTVADGTKPFLQQRPIVFHGVAPGNSAFRKPWAVLLEDIPNGKRGAALRAGVTIARVILNSSAHRRVHPAVTAPYLQSGFAGQARLLWFEAMDSPHTIGTQWAIIEFDGNPCVKLHGKTREGGIPAGSWNESCDEFNTGLEEVDVYEYDPSGKYVPLLDLSGTQVGQTVRNDVDAVIGPHKFIAMSSDDDGVFSVVVEGCLEGCEA